MFFPSGELLICSVGSFKNFEEIKVKHCNIFLVINVTKKYWTQTSKTWTFFQKSTELTNFSRITLRKKFDSRSVATKSLGEWHAKMITNETVHLHHIESIKYRWKWCSRCSECVNEKNCYLWVFFQSCLGARIQFPSVHWMILSWLVRPDRCYNSFSSMWSFSWKKLLRFIFAMPHRCQTVYRENEHG